jgi:hypothetical protein
MCKFGMTLLVTGALLVAGLLSWKAEATSPGTAAVPGLVKDYSLIQRTACGDTESIVRQDTSGPVVQDVAGALDARLNKGGRQRDNFCRPQTKQKAPLDKGNFSRFA